MTWCTVVPLLGESSAFVTKLLCRCNPSSCCTLLFLVYGEHQITLRATHMELDGIATTGSIMESIIYKQFLYTQAILVGYLFQHQQFGQRELSSTIFFELYGEDDFWQFLTSQKLSSPKFGTWKTSQKRLDSLFCFQQVLPTSFPNARVLGRAPPALV